MKKRNVIALTAILLSMTANMASINAKAYVRYDGTPPDTTGKTLHLYLENTDKSIVIEDAIVADGIFDSMEDLYGMTLQNGTTITAENLQEVWTEAHGKNPRYQWGDWTYGIYELTCIDEENPDSPVWEHGVYRVMPDFPVEKEITDCGYYSNYGAETQDKISDRGDYHFQKQEDGSLKWVNGIHNYPALDVPYTVLATKMECVTYTRNDSEPLPIDSHVYKSLVEQDMYLSSFRGFSNNYSLIYEGEFDVPTLYQFSDTGLPEECMGDVIHYRLVDFYDTFLFEDGYITFHEDGTVKDRFVERSGIIAPDGKAGLTLVMDEEPQKREYFWTETVEVTVVNENGEEVHDSDFAIPQPDHSGMIQKADVNGDGEISVTDLVFLQKYLHQQEQFDFGNYLNSDVNGDGKVNVIDLALLKKQLQS